MSETYLTLLAFVFIGLAGWRDNASAVWFGLLMFGHAIFLGHLAESDPMTYMATWGIFSTLSTAACYGFRKGIDDVIAFRMMGISAVCMLVNIICITVWLTGSPMGGFNWIFAGILLASIAVILKGDKDGLGTGTGSHLDSYVHARTDKSTNLVVGLENREASK